MKQRRFTYILSILFFLYGLVTGCTEGYAQRARDHRLGLVKADSVRTVTATDSIALPDTLDVERLQRMEALEAPVDTAALAQQSDSLQTSVPEKKERWIPNSNKTVWLGLIIPGAGQIYNRKYWKLPIIYGGFVGCAYALTWNGKMYKDYSQAYQDIMSNNPNNDSYMDFVGAGMTKEDIQNDLARYQELFRKRKDVYRRQRDLSIFAFIGVYLLSVIDAYVDAELSDFDISKDLGMKLEPAIFNDDYRHRPQGVGLQCSIKF